MVEITPVTLIDFVGIAVGIASIIFLLMASRKVGKESHIRDVLVFFIAGVAMNMLALVDILVFFRLELIDPVIFDTHHILMTVGMVLFVAGAYKFLQIVKR
jgi:hypothetical protein